jgi:hypothetical protein
LTKGYYVNLISQALERLAMQTFYNEEPPMDAPMPSNLRWQLPDNFFNISQLYAFNGECCDVKASANIYWKRNFNNAPNGNGYTALNKGHENNGDAFFHWGYSGGHGTIGGAYPYGEGLLYANVQNGFLMFSSSCKGYSSFRVIYNGFGGILGEKPLIPRPLRQVTIDIAVLSAFEDLQVRNPKSVYGAMIDRAKDKLYSKAYGSWWEAQAFVRMSSNWKKNCLELYGSAPLISS